MGIEQILMGLATERWTALRRLYNRQFMAGGPGADWDRYKASPQCAKLMEEEAVLATYLGKEGLRGG